MALRHVRWAPRNKQPGDPSPTASTLSGPPAQRSGSSSQLSQLLHRESQGAGRAGGQGRLGRQVVRHVLQGGGGLRNRRARRQTKKTSEQGGLTRREGPLLPTVATWAARHFGTQLHNTCCRIQQPPKREPPKLQRPERLACTAMRWSAPRRARSAHSRLSAWPWSAHAPRPSITPAPRRLDCKEAVGAGCH